MNRLILIAGAAAILCAGGAVAATPAQTNQAPAAQGQGGMPAGHGGMMGMNHGQGGPGMGMGGRQGMRGMRGGRQGGERLTLQERQARNATMFAQIDANKDGRATFEEFRAHQERMRVERQRRAFQGLSGGQDSVTLEQLNARTAERFTQRETRRGGGGGGR